MPRTRAASATAPARVKGAQRIEWWPVARLLPYDRNPRKHSEAQVVALMAAITEFGFTAPVLVDEAAGILAGHGRLEAAKRLGLRDVPVIELTYMTPAQKRAYVVADNKLPAMATWDERLLAEELRALEREDFDVHLTGFSDEDLQRLQDDLDQRELESMSSATAAPAQTAAAPAQPAEASSSSSGDSGELPAAAAPASPGGVVEQLPFSVIMSADDRARLFEALTAAKRKWTLSTSAQALLALANDFLAREAS